MSHKKANSILKEEYDSQGNLISPHLPEGVKNYLIDIDGTITDDIPNEEPERMATCKPFPDALEVLNNWYEQGHRIYFFTSRTEDHKVVTEKWLEEHGFNYHGVVYGKPRGGNYHWIDNHIVRATKFKGKFTELTTRMKKVQLFEEN